MFDMNFLETIQVFIILQCVIFCVYLFTVKSGNSTSNKLLGLFLIVLGLQMASNIFISTGHSFFYRSSISLRFLFGPLFYFYVFSTTTKDYTSNRKDLIHGLPFLLISVVLSLDIRIERFLFLIITYISLIGYLLITYLAINDYRKVLEETRSTILNTSLKWLQLLFYFQGAVIFLDLVNNFSYRVENWPVMGVIIIEMVLLLLMVNLMVIYGLKYPDLFGGIKKEEKLLVKDQKEKYASSALGSEDLARIKDELLDFIVNQKPYLDPELTLSDLAKSVSISNRELSQVINTQFHINFSEFINSYRIEEAIRIIEENKDPKKTVLEILFEVGFNSKSSFYTAFKKHTKMTPKVYWAKLESEQKQFS